MLKSSQCRLAAIPTSIKEKTLQAMSHQANLPPKNSTAINENDTVNTPLKPTGPNCINPAMDAIHIKANNTSTRVL